MCRKQNNQLGDQEHIGVFFIFIFWCLYVPVDMILTANSLQVHLMPTMSKTFSSTTSCYFQNHLLPNHDKIHPRICIPCLVTLHTKEYPNNRICTKKIYKICIKTIIHLMIGSPTCMPIFAIYNTLEYRHKELGLLIQYKIHHLVEMICSHLVLNAWSFREIFAATNKSQCLDEDAVTFQLNKYPCSLHHIASQLMLQLVSLCNYFVHVHMLHVRPAQ